jgi:DtxR family Mn-dependent transcriptional regulator
MKHALGQHAMDRLMQFVEFMRFCPRGQARWKEGFAHFCEEGGPPEGCRKCIEGHGN